MVNFPSDASATLILRTREWQTLNREQIRVRIQQAHRDVIFSDISARIASLAAEIQADPVANEIAGIINSDLDALRKQECLRVLRMFFFVALYAPTFSATLSAVTPAARRTVCDWIDAQLVKRLDAGEVIEANMKSQVVDMPAVVVTLLTQAMMMIRMKWEALDDAYSKKKFVRDIFNSQKGYSKSESSIIPWKKPSDFEFS